MLFERSTAASIAQNMGASGLDEAFPFMEAARPGWSEPASRFIVHVTKEPRNMTKFSGSMQD
jgi:hypothetical protein